ncbi:MAG: DoxX family membrane protein [Bacteroidales bacterium]
MKNRIENIEMGSSTLKNKIASWFLFLIILCSGYLVSSFDGFNGVFLFLLIAQIVVVVLISKQFDNVQLTLSRLLLGLLFIYSGIVKGVDPVGTEYRIVDYFIAFGTEWANPMALPLSVILNATEFMLGIFLLFNINIRFTSWLVLLMMVFFTFVTLNDALYNPVPDCGCFGDALILTNWQTFYKNLVIDALLLMVFLSRNRNPRWFTVKTERLLVLSFLIIFVGFEVYNIRHLPVMDFRSWKVGNKMVVENPLPVEMYVTYRNTNTSETREYLSPNYPYNDSSWIAEWEFVGSRIVDPNPVLHDLKIDDVIGNDYTDQIIANPDYQFMLVSFDLEIGKWKKIDQIKEFIADCNENGISMVVVTSSLPERVKAFKWQYELDVDIFYADDISLMTMIRSNPGLVLLKDGFVLQKWHVNDFPSFEDFQTKFVEN